MAHINYYDKPQTKPKEETEELTKWVIPLGKNGSSEDKPTSPLKVQYGGQHYKTKAIQPIEYILANELGFCEGNVIKYVTRYADKGGIEDLKKAKHYLEFLIEAKSKQGCY